MKFIDPICGMSVKVETVFRLQHGDHTVYFCAPRCMEKYAKTNGLSAVQCPSGKSSTKPWILNKNILILFVLMVLIGLSYLWPALDKLRENLLMYLRMIWWAILLGFLLGGLLERYVPKEYISAMLAQRKKRSVVYAVLLGFLMSACSHGILALSIELYKKGASTPVVVAFLLASPWANLPITLILLGFFGFKALYIILGALLIAFNTGLVFQLLEKQGMVEANPNTLMLREDYSVSKDLRRRAKQYQFSFVKLRTDSSAVIHGALVLADMTLWWVLIGVILSSVAAAFIPEQLFHQYMGPTLVGLLATLALATVMEVCSEGTAPLAFTIYKQSGAFGNAFVFLMAGVVTDFTEIGLIWMNVGKKTALWIPAVTVPQVIFFGILANYLFQ